MQTNLNTMKNEFQEQNKHLAAIKNRSLKSTYESLLNDLSAELTEWMAKANAMRATFTKDEIAAMRKNVTEIDNLIKSKKF